MRNNICSTLEITAKTIGIKGQSHFSNSMKPFPFLLIVGGRKKAIRQWPGFGMTSTSSNFMKTQITKPITPPNQSIFVSHVSFQQKPKKLRGMRIGDTDCALAVVSKTPDDSSSVVMADMPFSKVRKTQFSGIRLRSGRSLLTFTWGTKRII